MSGQTVTVPGIGSFDRIDPQDAFSWGLRLGYLATENVEIGFLFDQQSTTLEIGGTSTFELGDLSLRNYHGYFAYNFGDDYSIYWDNFEAVATPIPSPGAALLGVIGTGIVITNRRRLS